MVAVRLDRRDVGSLAFLLLVTLLFHWPLITPDLSHRQSYPEGDFYGQFHVFASYEHDRLWAGEIPLWNPYTFGGHPFLADVQAAVFYPPSLLAILLSGPGAFSPFWLELEAIVHYYLAALFTYLFVRRLVASRVGSLISALTFAFGGYLTSYPPLQLAVLETQVWLPLILFLLDVGLSERRWRFILGAGVAWGMALLAGHPQSAMYVLYAALLYGLFRSWRVHLPWRWAAGAHLGWVGVGFGIAAVHLAPAWEFMRLSVRASATYEELAAGFGLRDLVQYLLPGVFTYWSPVYVGVLPLFLAVVACLGGRGERGRSDVLFWSSLALLSLLLSLGGKTFVYRLFYWVVPGFNLFRSQERAIYLTGFSLAVLAGYGWSCLASSEPGMRRRQWARRGLLSLGVLSLVTTALVWGIGRGRPGFDPSRWLKRLFPWMMWTWLGWGIVRWTPALAGRGKRSWGAALSVVLVLADLSVASMTANLSPGLAQSRVYDGAWLASVLEDDNLLRIANEWGLPGNGGCWLRLQDLYGASPLRTQIHKAMADAVPHWRLWQLLDVRYVMTWEHDLPGPFPARRIAMRGTEWAKNTVYVHRLLTDFPRAWVVHRAQQVEDEQALTALADPVFDPFERVLLAGPVPAEFSSHRVDRSATVDVIAYAPEEMIVQADLQAPGWLVAGEWHYPGWQVWVDGMRQTIFRADYGLRAVPLAAGSHRVEFRYRPRSFYLGAMASALVWVMLAGLILRGLATRSRGRTQHGDLRNGQDRYQAADGERTLVRGAFEPDGIDVGGGR